MLKTRVMLAAVVSMIACTQPAGPALPEGGLSRAEFVAVMEELMLADSTTRPAVLERHRTSDAEIRAFIEAMSTDPHLLSVTLDSIQNKVERARMSKSLKTID